MLDHAHRIGRPGPTISTNDLSLMPDLNGFRRLTRSLATLDALLSPEWEDRYFSFDSHWSDTEMMASWRNGSGDHWHAVICPAGTALVGLAHEADEFHGGDRPWLFRDLPDEFRENVRDEPAFEAMESTVCIWRLATMDRWECGALDPSRGDPPRARGDVMPDGSEFLLSILAGDPQQYVTFASEYYGIDHPLEAVRAIYDHAPMTGRLARQVADEILDDELPDALEGIGYPEDD